MFDTWDTHLNTHLNTCSPAGISIDLEMAHIFFFSLLIPVVLILLNTESNRCHPGAIDHFEIFKLVAKMSAMQNTYRTII